ncbi:ABC transporter permease subunit [Olsenella sp. YH-ols2217]|uniref:ABC transporter permease subunit n=1 Tax=Kribbibacterium absianum TaxID=3044210 RepID=A0ABT6ZNA4_9ACTN|nr:MULTISPECIES: ABC transporter permease subunit [unclassified Olsenella]MDJ1122302.1 ABC transporter permease subunit [Olsenella sp. YH-ols2216]MDJ1130284.1 ABC transporter permease subunit [Olsenella sp. YH-ols2217]
MNEHPALLRTAAAPRPLRRRRLWVLVACLLVAALGAVAVAPATAQALTTDKATAKPNEDGGSGVIGGIETRLTWEGTVEDGEEVTSVTLDVPDGGTFDGSTTRVTVLEGLNRKEIDATATPDGNVLTIAFATPIEAGDLLRLEVTNMKFPAEGGDVVVTGTYETGDGESRALAESPAIATVANTPLQAIVGWLDEQPWVEAWNSNQFLGMFFKPQLLVTSFASLAPGWLVCLVIIVAAYPFAILLGLLFAFMKMAKHRAVRAVAVTYINILRGTPLFLQIYIMFFGLPMIGINIDNNVLGVIVMAVNSSAYLAEIFRAGIESIPAGQYEAADSLGMNRRQTMVSIILPQTVRRVLPTVTSDFITGYKDTSLLSSVGVMELMMYSKNLTAVSGNITPYIAAAIFYLIVTLPLIKVVGVVEKRLAASESGGGPRPKGGQPANEETPEVAGPEQPVGGPLAEAAAQKPSAVAQLLAPFGLGRAPEAKLAPCAVAAGTQVPDASVPVGTQVPDASVPAGTQVPDASVPISSTNRR